MGKVGVLWGRLVMKNPKAHHVNCRRNSTIYRRKTANLYTKRDARVFCNGEWAKYCLCNTRSKWLNLVISKSGVRIQSERDGKLATVQRGRNGTRANTVLSNDTSRDRQVGQNSIARSITLLRWNRCTSNTVRSSGPSRSGQPKKLGSAETRGITKTERNNGSNQKQKRGKTLLMASRQHILISNAEQGRSARKGEGVRDDATTLHEIYAVNTA